MKNLLAALLLALPALPARAEGPRRVLVIGDSHTVGTFGRTLDARLRTAFGPQVATYAVCGASLRWWQAAKRPKLSICWYYRAFSAAPQSGSGAYPVEPPSIADLAALKPDVVVVALGSNPDGPSAADSVAAGAELLKRFPSESTCYWIGPPPMPSIQGKLDAFYEAYPQLTDRAGRPCLLLDSRRAVRPGTSVNDHYSGKPAEEWAEAAFRFITAP